MEEPGSWTIPTVLSIVFSNHNNQSKWCTREGKVGSSHTQDSAPIGVVWTPSLQGTRCAWRHSTGVILWQIHLFQSSVNHVRYAHPYGKWSESKRPLSWPVVHITVFMKSLKSWGEGAQQALLESYELKTFKFLAHGYQVWPRAPGGKGAQRRQGIRRRCSVLGAPDLSL